MELTLLPVQNLAEQVLQAVLLQVAAVLEALAAMQELAEQVEQVLVALLVQEQEAPAVVAQTETVDQAAVVVA